jgi:hypothetical protein
VPWFDDIFGDDDLANGDFSVTREAMPEFHDGIEFRNQPLVFQTGRSSFQAAAGAQLRVIPEGLRADHLAQIWTPAVLQVEPLPDVLTVLGTEHPGLVQYAGRWRVYQVQRHVGHGAAHTVAWLSRIP